MSAHHERWVDENALQHQLRDLICLAVVGDHVRWVLTDDDELGDWLAEAAAQWRGWAEQVAARLVASEVAPDGRVRSLAKDIPLNWVPDGWLSGEAARPLIAERLARVAEWAATGTRRRKAPTPSCSIPWPRGSRPSCAREEAEIRAKRERRSRTSCAETPTSRPGSGTVARARA